MLKVGGVEASEVKDASGKPVAISTTARLAFRNAFPEAKKVRNNIINNFIADMFLGGAFVEEFKPRTGGGTGFVANVQGSRFIAIEDDSSIKVIAVKGSVPQLPALPETYTPPKMGGGSSAPAAPPPAPESPIPSDPIVSEFPDMPDGTEVDEEIIDANPIINEFPNA